MGRSENSRNRIFVEEGDGIRTQAFDPSKLVDPSLIIYAPVRVLGNKTIVTNGDQTDTIYELMDKQQTFEQALRTREFEPDAPNYTPRISGILHIENGSYHYAMSILKSQNGNPDTCNRYTFAYHNPVAGEGHFIHTYRGDGTPLPSFEGEPKLVGIPNEMDKFGDLVWNSLNVDNKVSLFIRFIDIETGEIRDRYNFTREEWDREYGVKISMPWDWFKKELEMRMADNPMYFFDDLRKMGYPYQEKVEPIFVSRMPNHKVTGAGHADTIRSPRHYKEKGIVLSKTDIKQLKLDKNGEIQDYYDPDSDRLLYEALKKQLNLFGGDAKKAFEKEFHKPKKDGSEGPIVRKVKLVKKLTMGVEVNGGTGIAENANGSMIRVDIFQENGKYFFVPIYTPDTLKKELPNRAATGGKAYEQWRVMKEENFLFSLYPRDFKPASSNSKCIGAI